MIGSGATGGWVAKRLTEAGVRVAMLEAGRPASDADYREHVQASSCAYRGPDEGAARARARPRQSQSYAVRRVERTVLRRRSRGAVHDARRAVLPVGGPHRLVGGRTNVWGRQSYRFSDLDFKAASRDGVGVDWPITYADLAPYYDLVEEYIGVSGHDERLSVPARRHVPAADGR